MVLLVLGVRMVQVLLLMLKVMRRVGLKLLTKNPVVRPELIRVVLLVLGVRMVQVLLLMLKVMRRAGP